MTIRRKRESSPALIFTPEERNRLVEYVSLLIEINRRIQTEKKKAASNRVKAATEKKERSFKSEQAHKKIKTRDRSGSSCFNLQLHYKQVLHSNPSATSTQWYLVNSLTSFRA